jgi:uncharacterized RDD family membrane protein YckC
MSILNKKELSDYSDDDLFSLVKNPKNLDKNRIAEITEELRKRGHSVQVENIVNGMIRLYPIYSKFWSRFGAYLLDILVLGITGLILGLFLGDTFVHMGGQSMLVGFFIALLYFGLGNSAIFNGQTLGKKIVNLQVVDNEMETLSIQKSVLRALIFTVPYFFLNYKLDGWSEFSIFYMTKGIFFLTFLILLPIHLILNTPTRQAIHDLIMGTYVVSREAFPGQQLSKSKSLPTIITGSLAIVILGLIIFMNSEKNKISSTIEELKPLKEQIDKIDKIGNSSLSRNSSSFKKFGSDDYISKNEYLKLNLSLRENLIYNLRPDNIEDLDFVKEAVRIILEDYSDINNLNYIQVNLIYGYNIGIYKSSNSIGFSNSIDNWREKVK